MGHDSFSTSFRWLPQMQPLEARWEDSNDMWLEDSSSFPWPATQIMTLQSTTEHHHRNGPLNLHLNSQQTMPLYLPPQSSTTILPTFTPFPHLFLLPLNDLRDYALIPSWTAWLVFFSTAQIMISLSFPIIAAVSSHSSSPQGQLQGTFSEFLSIPAYLTVIGNLKLMHSSLNTFMSYRLLWEMWAAESPLLLNSKDALELVWNHPGN